MEIVDVWCAEVRRVARSRTMATCLGVGVSPLLLADESLNHTLIGVWFDCKKQIVH